MLSLRGYRCLELVHSGHRSLVYRMQRREDGEGVIAKALRVSEPTRRDVDKMQREFDVMSMFDCDEIVRAQDFIVGSSGPVIVMEDFGGASLQRYVGASPERLSIESVFTVALGMARSLTVIHECGVLHRDIKPHNIIANFELGRVALSDFSVSPVVVGDVSPGDSSDALIGTLRYMAPEQTGRTGRRVDFRSDYYALGATLYELLTGRAPFTHKSPLELLHAHVARTPAPPHELASGVPRGLSRIVLKLLAKNPEERYQGAVGLRVDLERARDASRSFDFTLGERDIPARLTFPNAQIGRERDEAALQAAFAEVVGGGGAFALVSGPPGAGATSLCRALRSQVEERGGSFVEGRAGGRPHAPLVMALRDLLRRVLALPDVELVAWRARLSSALGSNAATLFSVFPELPSLVEFIEFDDDDPGEALELPASAAALRFRAALRLLVRACADERHPLIVFIDDLDLVGYDTLQLIEVEAGSPYLMWLATCGDETLDAGAPLVGTLARLQAAGVTTLHRRLAPLDVEALARVIAAAFRPKVARLDSLARLLHDETGGNPLALKTALEDLHRRALVQLDESAWCWEWEPAAVRGLVGVHGASTRLSQRLEQLSAESLDALTAGACLGRRFFARRVAGMLELDALEVLARRLAPALELGLIAPARRDDPGRYSFTHASVNASVLARADDARVRELHWRAGQLLMAEHEPAAREDLAFEITRHFNHDLERVKDSATRRELASLNLVAGRRAQGATDYAAASEHFTAGLGLLGDEAWTRARETAFALELGCVEVDYMRGATARALERFGPLLTRAATSRERATLLKVRVDLEMARSDYAEAIERGREALRELGMALPRRVGTGHIIRELARVRWRLRGRRVEDVEALPVNTDPELLLGFQLLMRVSSASYVERPQLAIFGMLRLASESLKRGNSPLSPFGYAGYAAALSVALGDPEGARVYSELALRLQRRFRAPEIESRMLVMHANVVLPWVEPLTAAIACLERATRRARSSGDLQNWSVAACLTASYTRLRGVPLARAAALLDRSRSELHGLLGRELELWFSVERQLLACLSGETHGPTALSDAEFDEAAIVEELESTRLLTARISYLRGKLLLSALFGRYEDGERYLRRFEGVRDQTRGTLFQLCPMVYAALCAAGLYRRASGLERVRYRRRIQRVERELARHAARVESTFAPRLELVRGALALALEDHGAALVHFGAVVELGREVGALHLEALGHEYTARARLELNQPESARAPLEAAVGAYERWGAHAKVTALRERYAEHLEPLADAAAQRADERSGASPASARSTSRALDLETVIKASRTISSEIVLGRLLERLLHFVLESAGARHGAILLRRDDSLWIEAEGATEPAWSTVMQSRALSDSDSVARSIVRYVARTHEQVVIDDARLPSEFSGDPRLAAGLTRSVLCTPILHHGRLTGVLYLENELTAAVFKASRLALLEQIAAQVAISIENARLYDNLDRARAQAVAADKAKTHFLMKMSHELRTPLNAVLGYAELLEESLLEGDTTTVLEDLNMIRRASLRLLRTLASILELSRIEAGGSALGRSEFTLAELLERVSESAIESIGESENEFVLAPLSEELRGELLNTDLAKLEYCLVSVIDNACRFNRGGRVRFDVEPLTRDGARWLRFCVEDTGIGIAPEYAPRLFEAFTQLDDSTTRQFEGSGVSLAVTRTFCRLLSGDITYTSELGVGTTFVIEIPTRAPEQDASEATG